MKKGLISKVIVTIDEILKNSKESDLNWKLIQNKNLLKKEQELIDEYLKPSEKFTEYEQKRMKLCFDYCEKNEDNSPKITKVFDLQGNEREEFTGLRENKEFIEKFAELNKEYEFVLKENLDKQIFYNTTIINEEVEIKFKKIKVSQIKNDIINGQQMEILSELIEDDSNE